ncbi:NUDIX hydrolase [Pseudonocardia humida]|uniref:NUDIX hydrolase n=1 Tax=Pseudonocardia humida TaxID=2800819 RepID=A0ABT1A2E2_9PSEU|nr:NUDIX hydrolase [Pseudonocardia humida]MCO1657126.1 NUDIX hydrolase [Pseudonocardia humida]
MGDIALALGRIGGLTASAPVLERLTAAMRVMLDGIEGAGPQAAAVRVRVARTLRAAAQARNAGLGDDVAAPPVTEEEIQHNLRPLRAGAATARHTDWQQVEEGAHQAESYLRAHGVTEGLLDALVGALDHQHSYARAAVVRSLARIDRPESRDAMLAEVLEPGVPAEVRRACVAGLLAQVESAPSPAVRAARRWLVLAAAGRADALGSRLVAAELGAVVESTSDGLLVERSGYEIADLAATGLRVVVDGERPPQDGPVLPVTAADRRAAGPDWEPKFCPWRLDLAGPEPTLRLAPTTWREGNAFHRAMRRTAELAPEQVDLLADGWLRSTWWIPGIASVHAVALTADGQVLLTRRSASSPYAPGRWSAGFEEQLTDLDVGADDVLIAAARRGAGEELGAIAEVVSVEPVSLVVEMPILGVAPVLLVRLGAELAELRAAATGRTHDRELTDLAGIPADPDAIRDHLARRDPATLHPTAGLRLRILDRLLRRRA